jgi:thiamine biosynthesis lipoprotein ApbE
MRRLKKAGMKWDELPKDVLDDAFARGGMQRLVLDAEHRRVSVTRDRLGRDTPLELDFGGIGKGFALDECAKVLEGEQFEMTDYLLDAGTSTQLVRGGPWKIGVGGVWKERTRQQTVLELHSGAVSGSGFELQGAHVVDVRRRTAARRWAQTWSRTSAAAVADALSTAALSMDAAEIERACTELEARVLVAHNQKKMMDLVRDPLKWIGSPIGD